MLNLIGGMLPSSTNLQFYGEMCSSLGAVHSFYSSLHGGKKGRATIIVVTGDADHHQFEDDGFCGRVAIT